jgi:hypothetical protein
MVFLEQLILMLSSSLPSNRSVNITSVPWNQSISSHHVSLRSSSMLHSHLLLEVQSESIFRNLLIEMVYACLVASCMLHVPHIWSPSLLSPEQNLVKSAKQNTSHCTEQTHFITFISCWGAYVWSFFCSCLSKYNKGHYIRFRFFTAMTMKNAVFWDATPCSSCKNRRLGGN